MRELLMLAKKYTNQSVKGWLWSEKLDGRRAFWDGGVSRGDAIRNIPWANTGSRNTLLPYSTGLWSRYGNVIMAPDWFLDGLPQGRLLDGELYLGPGCLQETISITSRHTPDARWRGITFSVFDEPSILEFCTKGTINNPNFQKVIHEDACIKYFKTEKRLLNCKPFNVVYKELCSLELPPHVGVLKQQPIGSVTDTLDTVVSKGGEGIMLRKPFSFWTPTRSKYLLKVKPHDDTEGVVIGYKAGLGKHLGRLGALIISWNGVEFDLSGFTDEERQVDDPALFEEYAGKKVDGTVHQFPIGSVVTFRYNGTTRDGSPREARYWRKYEQSS